MFDRLNLITFFPKSDNFLSFLDYKTGGWTLVWVAKHKFRLAFQKKSLFLFCSLYTKILLWLLLYMYQEALKSGEGLFVQIGKKSSSHYSIILCTPQGHLNTYYPVSNCSKSNFVSCSQKTGWYNITDINHYWQQESN